jgi:hypothetical protein
VPVGNEVWECVGEAGNVGCRSGGEEGGNSKATTISCGAGRGRDWHVKTVAQVKVVAGCKEGGWDLKSNGNGAGNVFIGGACSRLREGWAEDADVVVERG